MDFFNTKLGLGYELVNSGVSQPIQTNFNNNIYNLKFDEIFFLYINLLINFGIT
jgi:hypothetical protein